MVWAYVYSEGCSYLVLLIILGRGGVRVGSMGSIEPTDFWSLYVVNPWIFWQNISGIEYDCHYLDSSLVSNPWIEIPNATPGMPNKLYS